MTIQTDILNTAPPALIELFQVDLSSLGYSYILDKAINFQSSSVTFNGNNYDVIAEDTYPNDVIFTQDEGQPEHSICLSTEHFYSSPTSAKITSLGDNTNKITITPKGTVPLLESNDITVEFWLYVPSGQRYPAVGTGARLGECGEGFNMVLNIRDGKFTFLLGDTFGWVGHEIKYDVWQHIVCQSKYGSGYSVGIDGILYGPEAYFSSKDLTNLYQCTFGIGHNVYDISGCVSYIDNLKIYRCAKYNSNFTPNDLYGILYLTNNKTAINFGGNIYLPWPLLLEGLSYSSTGSPSRPTLTLGNLDLNRKLRDLVSLYSDLVGVPVKYIRTFETYLNTNDEIAAPIVNFVVGRKLSHTNKQIQLELRNLIDREKMYLPPKLMLKSDFPGLGTNRNIK